MFRAFSTLFLIGVSAICAYAGTTTCNGVATPSEVGTVWCADGYGGSSSITIDSTGFASAGANSACINLPGPPYDLCLTDWGSYSATLRLNFTGGPTGLTRGYFVPCLSGLYALGGAAQASFGSVSGATVQNSVDFFDTCLAPINPTNEIAFTVGTPQTDALSISDLAAGNHSGGQAIVNFSGFRVFDASGNDITSSVTYTLADVDVPEPSLLAPVAAALLCCVIARRRHLGR